MRQLPQIRDVSAKAERCEGASGSLPVRLTDIPIAIRRQFGRKLLDDASDNFNVLAAIELNKAIETPSETVYWIPVTAKSLPSVRRIFGKNWEIA